MPSTDFCNSSQSKFKKPSSPDGRTNNEQARNLRKHFVFKIVQMLNPDGVSRGMYRMDTKAYNLNRYYLNPDPKLHPTIYGIKKLVVHYTK